MNEAIKAMLQAYGPIHTTQDETNALKEVLQRIVLLGLHRSKFFERAAFYGGTALRLLYGLDRFSEDIDCCLLKPDVNFALRDFFVPIRDELERFGFIATIDEKNSGPDTVMESAFVKQPVSHGLIVIGRDHKKAQKGQLVKIKLEVDKTNPPGFVIDKKLIKLPSPFLVTTLTESSLFAGKLHALLARSYVNRVKGRDYYDFLFYAARGTPVNLTYLEAKLRDSGHYESPTQLTIGSLISMLDKKFSKIDFEKVKADVRPFVSKERLRDLESWEPALFVALAQDLKGESPAVQR